MMDGDCFLRVQRFSNGFTVEIKDPVIVKYNRSNDKIKDYDKRKPYKDPWKSFVFPDEKAVETFITKNIGKAVVAADDEIDDEFGTAFAMAVATPEKK